MSDNTRTKKKLTFSIVAIVILTGCLAITTIALVVATISVDTNLFLTGKVEINLNDGKPVIEEHDFLFEPGMTVEKDFFIENNSTWDVYYKLYFDHIEGGLADVLEVQIKDSDRVLFSGTAAGLAKTNVQAADDILGIHERRDWQIVFHFPKHAGNAAQNLDLSFDFCADAVQTKNNPHRLFD